MTLAEFQAYVDWRASYLATNPTAAPLRRSGPNDTAVVADGLVLRADLEWDGGRLGEPCSQCHDERAFDPHIVSHLDVGCGGRHTGAEAWSTDLAVRPEVAPPGLLRCFQSSTPIIRALRSSMSGSSTPHHRGFRQHHRFPAAQPAGPPESGNCLGGTGESVRRGALQPIPRFREPFENCETRGHQPDGPTQYRCYHFGAIIPPRYSRPNAATGSPSGCGSRTILSGQRAPGNLQRWYWAHSRRQCQRLQCVSTPQR